MATVMLPVIPTIPPTPLMITITLPVMPAFLAPLMTVMPMPPSVHLRMHTGHVNHAGWWRRGVDHTRWGRINHLAGKPDLRMNREMTNTRVHNHRGLHRDRMGATHLGQAQHQTAQEQGFARPGFEQHF